MAAKCKICVTNLKHYRDFMHTYTHAYKLMHAYIGGWMDQSIDPNSN